MASIIVAPTDLAFHSSESVQKFEIYNVHQYPVKFVVKATAPEKYIISNTEGMVNTQCKVSIYVTHVDICATNEGIRDIFRIYFSHYKHKKFEPIGQRDVCAVLYANKSEKPPMDTKPQKDSPASARKMPQSCSTTKRSEASLQLPRSSTGSHQQAAPQGYNLLFYVLPILILICCLWLPTRGTSSGVPWYLQVTTETKFVMCFLLGLLVATLYGNIQNNR